MSWHITDRQLIIEAGTTSIGYREFHNNTAFDKVIFEEPCVVTSIGSYAFDGCTKLTEFSVPDSVRSVSGDAFRYCSALTKVYVGKNVQQFTNQNNVNVFDFCPKLSEIVVAEDNHNFDSRNNCNAIIETATNKLITGGLLTIIPAGIVEIKDSAFSGSEIASISLPDSVCTLSYKAFAECTKLASINLPSNLETIGNSCFLDCEKLTSINIPKAVNSIGSSAFFGCTSIQSIIVDAVNIKYDSRNSCNAIIETATDKLIFACNNTTIPNGIKIIDSYAFSSCKNITSLTLPEGVTTLNNHAFYDCSKLKTIKLSQAITKIPQYCFWGTGITTYIVPSHINALDRYAFNNLTFLYIPSTVTTLDYRVFGFDTGGICLCQATTKPSGWESIWYDGTTPTILWGKEPLEYDNFYYIIETDESSNQLISIFSLKNKTITNLNIPEVIENLPVKKVYRGVFSDLKNCLVSVYLPNTITSLPEYCFFGCKQLETINLESIADLGDWCFLGCSKLNNVALSTTLTEIPDHCFEDCSSLDTIFIPENVLTISYRAFAGCNFLAIPSMPGVTTFESYVFYNCKNLLTGILSSTIQAVGNDTFNGCSSLIYSFIPDSVVTLGFDQFPKQAHIFCETSAKYNWDSDWNYDSEFSVIYNTSLSRLKYLDNILYFLNEDSSAYSVVAADLAAEELIIKEKIDNIPVTNIGSAFKQNIQVKKLIIEAKLIELPAYCFSNMTTLEEIILPDTLSVIKQDCFAGCSSLKDIILPDSLTTLGGSVFSGCTSLESITIPKNVISIGGTLFPNASSLTSLIVSSDNTKYDSRDNCNCIINTADNKIIDTCTSSTIPASITTLDAWAFSYKQSLTSIAIPNTVTAIGEHCFHDCENLVNVVLPETASTISVACFADCKKLSNIVLPDTLTVIDNLAFANTGLTSISIPDSVHTLGYGVFDDCTSLSQVNINTTSQLTSWGSQTFENTAITSLYIPAGISVLPAYLFAESKIETIEIPSNVHTIEHSCFYNCHSLINLTIPATVTTIEERLCMYADSLVSLSILGNPTIDTYCMCLNCSALASVNLPESTQVIGTWCFNGCKNLENIVLPDNITTIGFEAFNSSGLTAINIPKNVNSIYYNAFFACTKLAIITVDAENTIFDSRNNCNCLIETATNTLKLAGQNMTTIPETVTILGDYCFRNCSNIETLTIPSSVTTIGSKPLSGCTQLNTLTFSINKTLSDFGATTQTLKTVNFHGAEIAASAFANSNLQVINLSDNLLTINTGAFRYTDCQTIHIPNSVVNIASDTFTANRQNKMVITTELAEIPEGWADGWYDDTVMVVLGCNTLVTIDDITYALSLNNTAIVTGYVGTATEVIIPETITYNNIVYTINEIGKNAFYANTIIQKISLPNTITKIDDYSFYNCSSLTTINFPTSLVILGISAFYQTRLSSFDVGKCTALTTIGSNCFNLSSSANAYTATIPLSVTSIGNYGFYGSARLIFYCEAVSKPDGWDTSWAKSSGGTTIYWGVRTYNGFVLTNYTEDTNTYKQIIAYAGEAVTEIVVPGVVDGVAVRKITTNSVFTGKLADIQKLTFESDLIILPVGCFSDRKSLKAINFLGNFKLSGTDTFKDCNSLESLDLTKLDITSTTIPNNTFKNCFNLKNIDWAENNNITSIGQFAFFCCYNLTDIKLQKTKVITIGAGAFAADIKIRSIILPATVTTIGNNAFDSTYIREIYNLSALDIKKGATTFGYIAEQAFYVRNSLDIPTEIKKHESSGLYYIKNPDTTDWLSIIGIDETKSELLFPESIEGISKYDIYTRFIYQQNITKITVPNGVDIGCGNPVMANIFGTGYIKFNNCSNLIEITIEAGSMLKFIEPTEAFANCPVFTTFSAKNSAFIGFEGSNIFSACPVFTTLDIIWSNITYLHYNSLLSLGKISYLEVTGLCTTPSTVSESAFSSDITLCYSEQKSSINDKQFSVSEILYNYKQDYTHNSITYLIYGQEGNYEAAVAACDSTNNVVTVESTVLNATVNRILHRAFNNLGNLTTIILPDTLKYVGAEAIYKCPNYNYNTKASTNGNQKYIGNVANPYRILVGYHSTTTADTYSFELDQNCKVIASNFLQNYTGKQPKYLQITGTNTVEYINKAAFKPAGWQESYTHLTKFDDLSNVIEIDSRGFSECRNINLSSSVNLVKVEAEAFYGSNFIDGILDLSRCTQLENPVTKSYTYTFAREVRLPNHITSIGEYAFYNSPELQMIQLPSSLINIASTAFFNCSEIKAWQFPATLSAFTSTWGYQSILAAYIPKAMTAVGLYDIFIGKVYYEGTEEEWHSIENIDKVSYGSISYNSNAIALSRVQDDTFYFIEASNSDIFIYEKYYTAAKSSINLEDMYPNKTIIGLGSGCFSSDSYLSSITFPQTLEFIGDNCFNSCKLLTEITLPESIKFIGSATFRECSGIHNNLVLPINLTSIGDYAFYQCSNIPSITILSGNLNSISIHCFNGCSSATTVSIADGVKSLLNYSLANLTSLTQLTLPVTLEYISSVAFYGTNIQTEQYDNALYYITPTDRFSILYKALDTSITSCIIHENTKIICNSAFANCDKLASIVIPQGVKSLGISAFRYCKSLISISIPNSVTMLGDYCFYEAIELKDLTIGNGITEIPAYCFGRCTALTTIILPNTLTKLGTNCFNLYHYACNLKRINSDIDGVINFPTSLKTILSANISLENINSVNIPEGVNYIDSNAFKLANKTHPINIFIPQSLSTINTGAFVKESDSYSLECGIATFFIAHASKPATWADDWYENYSSYYAIDTVWNITEKASYDKFDYLVIGNTEAAILGYSSSAILSEELVIPEYIKTYPVKAIESCAFYKNSTITKLIINAQLTKIGPAAFSSCNYIKECSQLPSTLKTIGAYAFYSAGNSVSTSNIVSNISIPANIEYIGLSSFQSCHLLSSTVTFNNSLTYVGTEAFFGSGITSVDLSNTTITKLWEGCFKHCYSLASLALPTTLNTLGKESLYGCCSLAQSAISGFDLITTFEANACSYCTSFSTITLKEGLTIGADCFAWCSSAQFYCKDASKPSTWASTWNSSNRPVLWGVLDFYTYNNLKLLELQTGYHLLDIIDNGTNYISIPALIKNKQVISTAALDTSKIHNIIISSENTYLDSRNNCNCIIETATNKLLVGSKNSTIPNTVTEIAEKAFWRTPIVNLTIPESVLTICSGALSELKYLETITIPYVGRKKTLHTTSSSTSEDEKNGVFVSIFGLTQYEGGHEINSTHIWSSDTGWYIPNSLREITITEGISYLNYRAFSDLYRNVTDEDPQPLVINLPESIVKLEKLCLSLETKSYNEIESIITIPNNGKQLEYIGNQALSGRSTKINTDLILEKFTSFEDESGQIYIDKEAFDGLGNYLSSTSTINIKLPNMKTATYTAITCESYEAPFSGCNANIWYSTELEKIDYPDTGNGKLYYDGTKAEWDTVIITKYKGSKTSFEKNMLMYKVTITYDKINYESSETKTSMWLKEPYTTTLTKTTSDPYVAETISLMMGQESVKENYFVEGTLSIPSVTDNLTIKAWARLYPRVTIDLNNYEFDTGLNIIKAKAKAEGKKDSNFSNSVEYTKQ